ncbi:hypothetical protein [Paraburkholderia sp. GAS82]|uniref:hypothetical protein n=1 Tax=Paraburkholderia sp. GAS82 TaxID=3035137 RepID=UPI003D1CBCF3
MEHRFPPTSCAFAVYFSGGIQYCFDSAPKGLPTIVEVERSLAQIVWQKTALYGVPVLARRNGFVIFDFEKSPEYAYAPMPAAAGDRPQRPGKSDMEAATARLQQNYRRFQYMSAFLMALHAGLAETMKAGTPVQAPLNPVNYLKAWETGGTWKVTTPQGHATEGANFLAQDLKLGVLDHAVRVMERSDEVFGEDGLKILALCLTAGHQYSLHQFESAHLIAWSVIEKQINKIWADLMGALDEKNGGHTKINSKRRETLTGRDYTASIVTQMLSLHGKIDDNMLSELNKARQTRNDFAHNLGAVTWQDAAWAIGAANQLITKVVGLVVSCQTAITSYG